MRWLRFLHDTFGDDAKGEETIRFLHLLLGYSVTSGIGAQVLPFLYATGANGKSVLLDVMTQILGDYAQAARPASSWRRASSPSTPPNSPNSTAAASSCAPS
ncbi:hypothetical protein GCM10011583_70160 [Streptomyces camponoticapitis]|uniref:Uncharacterized protein n=1 Tax=Streptomyces camponoticapitis TaxID=1616125 RepID=A0ABQ2EYT7_9ACTN|nr:hypothetical protein GCM10011583_70160 [Streptomyces camponoticapitis]